MISCSSDPLIVLSIFLELDALPCLSAIYVPIISMSDNSWRLLSSHGTPIWICQFSVWAELWKHSFYHKCWIHFACNPIINGASHFDNWSLLWGNFQAQMYVIFLPARRIVCIRGASFQEVRMTASRIIPFGWKSSYMKPLTKFYGAGKASILWLHCALRCCVAGDACDNKYFVSWRLPEPREALYQRCTGAPDG